ncbi:hypothetical protein ACQKEY_19585 [Lysinibacillus fusiformis]|uniref:hypothetical protein n=1 Tax=Lysinibacillus fusiformis TaxID=28031 RepID=UPI000D3B57B2|nr:MULTISPECIES: hypothetical protein [Lysinibacillus]MED4670592.1 hypothetical protein [Lysinibacillus fusiformis]QAS56823.1 hypothetical protein LSP_10825 [Lysinibacillus sphaericus]RDV32342.1 hypothetical protein C7B90_10220 [Lysinibacillus fusiformis]GED62636.1 hypothetical protein LFU01_10880 [Lysinibacillus fusiformis]
MDRRVKVTDSKGEVTDSRSKVTDSKGEVTDSRSKVMDSMLKQRHSLTWIKLSILRIVRIV